MTEPHTRAPAWLQCVGKEQFSSPQLAAKVARRRTAARKRGGQQERPMGSYRCPHCGFFHIGGEGR
jgi:predicted RNA-binding Zn-ribbon protein involved in translation (DUF1610 family)